MSKFPIICGILGKKLYLTILLALVLILYIELKGLIPTGNDIPLINNLGGPVIEMLSVFIPYIFKLKGKSKASKKKCTKSNFKDYFIFCLITFLFFGINYFIEYLNIVALSVNVMWIGLCFQMICYFFLSMIILKSKYYIHNIISLILFCIFTVIIDLIIENLKYIELKSFLFFIPNLVDNILSCYMKYLIDKKYHSYWNVLFFFGLFIFIVYTTEFIIKIKKEPNTIFKVIENGKTKYIILNFLLDAIVHEYLRMLLTLLILEYFSFNHVFISHLLYRIVIGFIQSITNFDSYKNYLFFLIPAFFQVFSLLFYLEILEFNFCNLNRNTKRNIMLREEEEMLLRNNTNVSDIEIDKDLIIKNPTIKKDLELNIILNDDTEENDNNNDDEN